MGLRIEGTTIPLSHTGLLVLRIFTGRSIVTVGYAALVEVDMVTLIGVLLAARPSKVDVIFTDHEYTPPTVNDASESADDILTDESVRDTDDGRVQATPPDVAQVHLNVNGNCGCVTSSLS